MASGELNVLSPRESIDFLISVGILIPYKNLSLYHGRSAIYDKEGEEWQVNSRFNNSDNSTGNKNVNAITALSTASKELAQEFADKRNTKFYYLKGKKVDTSKSRIYKIISTDKSALIFNSKFDYSKLTSEQRLKVVSALRVMTNYSLSSFAPVKFEDRENYIMVYEALKKETISSNQNFVTFAIIEKVYAQLVAEGKNVDKNLLIGVGGAFNTKKMLTINPSYVANKYTLEKDPELRNSIADYSSSQQNGPLSMEYFASWAYNNHIIGSKTSILSVTAGREIENYIIFDTKKINTEKAVGDKMQRIVRKYSEIENLLGEFSTNKQLMSELAGANAENAVSVMANHGFGEPYKLSAGVWEGFSVGEHTETVLRVFEDSFNDEISEKIKPFMKFVILAHDIGKGYAFQKYGKNKDYEKISTREFCEKYLFDGCKVKDNIKDLVLFTINEGQDIMANIYLPHLRANLTKEQLEEQKKKMVTACQNLLKDALGREPTMGEVFGLISVNKILLTCDGGAYTRYAVTRDSKTGMYYRNGNDRFTKSYKVPDDIRGRSIEFPEFD